MMNPCKRGPIVSLVLVGTILLLAGKFFLGDDDESFLNSVTAERDPSTRERNLRIVSYNLWCFHFGFRSMWGLDKRIKALAEGLKDFDIALIQEAYILNVGITLFPKCASLVVSEMTKRGFHYRTSLRDFLAPYVGNGGGIVIFSRFPFARLAAKQYDHYSFDFLQVRHYRGFVIGEYIINSQHLFVVNTHLDHIQAKTRTHQANELAEELKKIPPASHVIVGGDFNINNRSPILLGRSQEHIELLNSMNETGLQSVFPPGMETNFDGGCYDAIFKSSNVKIIRKQVLKLVTGSGDEVSDHYGLSIEIKIW
ncbi:sphingomyelinase C-like [Montipora foliosa]|uniref:sphingomyelinase C-like n=1 Tax=Montipora foliosa TaxID=591990 RepID=UPI0035F15BB2